MSEKTRASIRLSSAKTLAVIAMVVVYSGAATYYVMSDTSVRGLTVRIFNVSRSCTADSGTFPQVANYLITASVWSTHSLRTSLNSVQFSLTIDGAHLGTSSQSNVSFDPGKSAPFTPTFKDLSVDPSSLPLSPELVLSITATVSAGVATSTLTRSDSFVQNFVSTSC